MTNAAAAADSASRARAAAYVITAAEGSTLHLGRILERPQDFDPETRDRFLAGTMVPAIWVQQAQRFRSWFRDLFRKIFENVDVLLAPATPFPALPSGTKTFTIGGETMPGPGAYMQAGILTDVPIDPALMGEEIFGPIAMLFKAADIDDAIAIANAIPFGLGSSVWTEDAAEEARFVRDVQAGMTAVNQMLASAPEAPFGGVKRSGHGRELGPFGLHEFMNLKSVYRR